MAHPLQGHAGRFNAVGVVSWSGTVGLLGAGHGLGVDFDRERVGSRRGYEIIGARGDGQVLDDGACTDVEAARIGIRVLAISQRDIVNPNLVLVIIQMVESHPNLLTGIGAQVDGVLTPVVIAVVVAETHRGVIAATVGRAAPNHREVAGGRPQ